eukprot:SAG22_NODE_692_length_7878_cov_6.834812_5_plen_95_part_00
MLCGNKLAAPKCFSFMHTHAATACFFVLDARRSVELRIPPKDAVEDVKGAAAARGGEGGGASRARPVGSYFLVRQEESDLLFFFKNEMTQRRCS